MSARIQVPNPRSAGDTSLPRRHIFRFAGNDLFEIPKHNQENAQTYAHNHIHSRRGAGKGLLTPRSLSSALPGKGSAPPAPRRPSARRHLCNTGKCGARRAARRRQVLRAEVTRKPGRGTPRPRSLERQRAHPCDRKPRRFLRVPIQSRGRPGARPAE